MLLIFSFLIPVYAEKLYVDAEQVTKNFPDIKLEDIFIVISKEAASNNIELIDYNKLELVPYSYFWGQRKRGQLESEKLIEEKKKKIDFFERNRKIYENSHGDSGQKEIQKHEEYLKEIDNKITAAQEKEKSLIEPDTCYPRLVLEHRDYVENLGWTERHECRIDVRFYISYTDTGYDITTELNPNFFSDIEDKKQLIAKTITAFFPLTNKKNKKIKQAEFIDQREMTELGNTRSVNSLSIVSRNDFSFVMRVRNSICDYSPIWDVKDDLSKKIIGDTTSSTYWVPYSPDGKQIIFANQGTPSVIYVDENNSIKGRVQYKFPSTPVSLNFFPSGDPCLFDLYNRIIYLPQRSSGQINEMEFPLTRALTTLSGSNQMIWTVQNNLILGFSTKDKKLKKIVLLQKNDEGFSYVIEKVLADGSFLGINRDYCSIAKFSKKGEILWTMPFSKDLQYSEYCGGDYGIYFFYDASSNYLWRAADPAVKLPPDLIALKDNNKKLENASLSEMAKIYKSNADTLYASKSYESALDYYKKYLEISPADPDAAEKKLMSEVAVNKKTAAEKSEEAINLYDEYGEETAKTAYQESMKLLEKLKKQVPWDEEVQVMYADLKNAFSTDGGVTQATIPSIEITSFDFSVLFPVLMNVYASNPAGFIKIKNNGKKEIKNISVASYVRKYMDFPSKGAAVSSLMPGSEDSLEISAILNKKALLVSENTVLQMQFTITWEEGSKSKSLTVTRPVTLYKKSAMTWDDTAMLSCFVQPNNPSVSKFAFDALAEYKKDVISKNISKAIVLSNAIGSIPLTYVADPVTPVSNNIDVSYSVDTVRFPSETLQLKGGDCDDMTTLFCSLLESAGITTAFITTPGHIFAAFDTGLKKSKAWNNLDESYKTIIQNGHIWIPIETTILNEGFDTAWKTASREISENKYECTPLHDAWKVYVTVDNVDEKKDVDFSNETLKKLNTQSATEVKNQLIAALKKITSGSPSELNAAARLWYSLGEKEKAVKILSALIKKAPDYKQAYTNLTALYFELGKTDEANQIIEKASHIENFEIADLKNEKKDSRASQSKASGINWKD